MKTSRPTYAVRVSIVAIICISVTVLAAGWSPAGWMGDRPLVRGLVRWASAPRLGFGGSPAPFAPAVTATKAAAFAPVSPSLPVGGDADADGKADPGDTIRYTVTVSDLTDPATGVHFADTPDPNTTLVGGSIIVSPLAINESYNSVGNMTLTSSAIAADCGTNPLRSVTCNDSLNGATLTGFGPAPGTANVMAPGGTVTTASNGSVVLNADGTFVYNPAAGFEGADTFWYTLTSPSGIAGTDNAQVTINVGGANGMVWFVSSAGGGGGRQNSPISLASFRLLNNGTGTNPASGDTIFLFEGAHPLTSTLILLATQKVIGQDTTGTLANLGAPTPQSGNSYPAVNNPTGTAVSITSTVAAVTLGSDNTLAGFTIGNSTTALIAAGSVGSLRVRVVIIGTNGQAIALTGGGTVVTDPTFTGFTSVSTTGGAFGINLSNIAGTLALGGGDLNGNIVMAFNVNGGNATITYSGTIRNSGARQVSIVNKTGGAVTLSGAVGGTGTGVFLDNNDQSPGVATMTFTGGLALSTGTNAAFTATNGGTVNVCDKNPCGSATAVVNTLATSTGTALNVTNTTIGGSGLTFRSITSSGSGSANGIILNTTGSTGGLTVTGNGSTCTSAATCTGGTISNKTGADGTGNGIGIYLNNTANVSITLMKLNDFSNYAVRGTNVTGFTMSNCVIDGVNGNNGGADEGTIIFDGLFGTSLFSGDTIKGGIEDNFRIINSSGTSNVTIDNSTIRDTSTSASGNDNVNLRSTVNGSITAHITNSIFAATNGDHIQTIASDQSSIVIVATGNTLSGGGGGSALGQGITISGGSAAPVDSTEVVRFNISSNNMTGTISGGAININEGSGNGNWQGQINGNTIGNAGSACSGASASSGVRLENHSKGTLTGIVSNNLIHQTCGAGGGISLSAGDTTASGLGNGPLNATVTGNTVDTPGGSADHGVVLVGGAGVTDNTNQICLDLKNNTSEGSHVVGSSGFGYRIRQRFNQTVFLPGYGGANNNNAAVEAYFVARPNTAIAGDGGTYSVTNTVGVAPPNGPGGGFVNGGAQCAQPIVMAMNAVAPSGSLASTEAPRQNYSPLALFNHGWCLV